MVSFILQYSLVHKCPMGSLIRQQFYIFWFSFGIKCWASLSGGALYTGWMCLYRSICLPRSQLKLKHIISSGCNPHVPITLNLTQSATATVSSSRDFYGSGRVGLGLIMVIHPCNGLRWRCTRILLRILIMWPTPPYPPRHKHIWKNNESSIYTTRFVWPRYYIYASFVTRISIWPYIPG